MKSATLSVLTFSLMAASQAQSLDTAKLDQFFDRLAEKNKAMGCLTIAQDGKTLYTRAIGYSQLEPEKKSLTPANRFRIGSITKMFTGTMTLQLVEEGKLKLEDTLDKFYPQVPNASKITIEQMLTHRSGIPNVHRERVGQQKANTLPVTPEEMLAFIAKSTPVAEPGIKLFYSNTAYYLLGLIIEKVTGKSFDDALRERIDSRIGLKDTYNATGNIDVSKNEALTYITFGTGWRQVPETHPTVLFGGGSIISTPSDLAKFIQALFDLKLISEEHLNFMKTLREGDEFGMMEPFNYAGKTFYGHTGGADNYGSWVMYQPEDKLAVAYTSNAKVYPVGEIIKGVVEIYYHKPFQIPSLESVALSAEILDRYVGTYVALDAPVKATITREGTTLYFRPPNSQNTAPLEATAENKFKIDAAKATFEFDVAKKQMMIKRPQGERTFTKE